MVTEGVLLMASEDEVAVLRSQFAETQQERDENERLMVAFRKRCWEAEDELAAARASLAEAQQELDEWQSRALRRYDEKMALRASLAATTKALEETSFFTQMPLRYAIEAYEDVGVRGRLLDQLAVVTRAVDAALSAVGAAPAHDCAEHTVSGDEGTAFCARCEQEARACEEQA